MSAIEKISDMENQKGAWEKWVMDCIKQCFRLHPPYRCKGWCGMALEMGAYEAAIALLDSPKIHDGLWELAERARWDLSVEYGVLHDSEWPDLFTDRHRRVSLARLREVRWPEAA